MANKTKRNWPAYAALVCLCVVLTVALTRRGRADAARAGALDDPIPTTAAARTQPAATLAADPAGENLSVARIRDEGMNRSQVMQTLSYLSDVIGPRLTGSPNLRRANQWTRQTMASWGLANAHLEKWGPFGRGWSLKRFSIRDRRTAGDRSQCLSAGLVAGI